MSFVNRIRLPFELVKPQIEKDKTTYTKGNGQIVTLQVVLRKTYQGQTDYLPFKLHERLEIALSHDSVTIEGDNYIGQIAETDAYNIEWQDFKNYPIAQGKFKITVTPYDVTNSNCGVCEAFSQVICNDDDAGTLDEDTSYTIDVLANDDICCSPVTISLVTYNTDYLDSAVINPDNTITIHTKTTVPTVTGITLLTYRAQCNSGFFDEANVTGGINGTDPTPVCNPVNVATLILQSRTDTTATIAWTGSGGAISYNWNLYLSSDLSTPVQTGTATTLSNSVNLTGLTPNTAYRFYIQAVCSDSVSPFVYIDFSTFPPAHTDSCGQYTIAKAHLADGVCSYSYMDCNGNIQTGFLTDTSAQLFCALQTSPGMYVSIEPSCEVNFEYVGLC